MVASVVGCANSRMNCGSFGCQVCECYNHGTDSLPALCLLDTSDKSFFFMPTIFVVHLMLDSYGQPHFLTYTVPCPLPLFYIWFLPYYEYGSIPCSLIRTFPCTYMYINPCT